MQATETRNLGVSSLFLLTRELLDGLDHLARLGPIVFISRGDPQGQQVAQGIDGHMGVTAPAPLGPVVTGPPAALAGALQGARVEHHRAGLRGAVVGQAQHGPQVMDQGLEDLGADPALGLLVHHSPGWKLMRDQSPRRSGAHHPTHGIEDLTQGVTALATIFTQQGEVWGNPGPFLIRNVTGIGLTGQFRHPRYTPSAELVHDRFKFSPWPGKGLSIRRKQRIPRKTAQPLQIPLSYVHDQSSSFADFGVRAPTLTAILRCEKRQPETEFVPQMLSAQRNRAG
jgi:hypothetical protein